MMTSAATINQVLRGRAHLAPDTIAIRDLDRELTNRQWNARASRLANALTGLGLEKGDRFAILSYNRIEWAEIYLAAAKSGLIAVPLNFRLTGSEIAYILNDVEASAILVEDLLADVVEAVRDQLPVPDGKYILIGAGEVDGIYKRYEDLLAAATEREPGQAVAPEDTWCILYTSGTTGNPKGAVRNHASTVRLALMTGIELSIIRGDDALLVMPLCHANSLYFFVSFFYCGARISIFSRSSFDPELCLKTIGERGHTFTSLVPTHCSMLLDARQSGNRDDGHKRITRLMVSSAPAREQLKRSVMEMFPNSGLFELYGSTEAGWVTMLHPHEQFEKLDSIGREVVGSQPIKLADDDGNEVPDGEPGELFSAGPCNFSGYWRLPEKTAEAFIGDHLSVGDMAMRDQDGYIRLVDRKNNMIISGGENIYPSEVEAALAAHPAVADVAVIGKPDDKWGETVHAVVIRSANACVSEQELIDWAAQRLAGFKRPRQLSFIAPADMPRNATGKILHRKLRETMEDDAFSSRQEPTSP